MSLAIQNAAQKPELTAGELEAKINGLLGMQISCERFKQELDSLNIPGCYSDEGCIERYVKIISTPHKPLRKPRLRDHALLYKKDGDERGWVLVYHNGYFTLGSASCRIAEELVRLHPKPGENISELLRKSAFGHQEVLAFYNKQGITSRQGDLLGVVIEILYRPQFEQLLKIFGKRYSW